MRLLLLRIGALAGVCAFLTPAGKAATIITQTWSGSFPATITGTLPNQNTALLENFDLAAPGSVTITTNSYATGGFEPNVLLFDSTGSFLVAGAPFGTPDPSTGIIGDAQLTALNLPAGMYAVALTDFLLNQSLTATNLSDGFTVNYGSGTTFVDANGSTRTGNYSFTIATSSASAVPEPGTLWLTGPLALGLLIRARKRIFV